MFDLFCQKVEGTLEQNVDQCITSDTQDIHFTFDSNATTGCSLKCHDAFDGLRDDCTSFNSLSLSNPLQR